MKFAAGFVAGVCFAWVVESLSRPPLDHYEPAGWELALWERRMG